MTKINSVHTVFYSIDKAIKEYRKYAQSRIQLEEPNITLDQALLLSLINERKEYSQSELSRILFKDFASITRMVELLVKNDFLTRSTKDEDRRRSNLKLTTKGKLTVEKLAPIIFENRRNALRGITGDEQEKLKVSLDKIIQNCK